MLCCWVPSDSSHLPFCCSAVKEVPFHKLHKLFELMQVWILTVWRGRLAYQRFLSFSSIEKTAACLPFCFQAEAQRAMGIVKGANWKEGSGCAAELWLFCNYVNQKPLSVALDPLQMARQLFSIDKWFVPRKTVTFCFRIVSVAYLLGCPSWNTEKASLCNLTFFSKTWRTLLYYN
jgi:hypothetical protein